MVRFADRFKDVWPLPPSEVARRAHERWLNAAISTPGAESLRIPVRRVEHGGYATLRSTRVGRESASQWWTEAIDRADTLVKV